MHNIKLIIITLSLIVALLFTTTTQAGTYGGCVYGSSNYTQCVSTNGQSVGTHDSSSSADNIISNTPSADQQNVPGAENVTEDAANNNQSTQLDYWNYLLIAAGVIILFWIVLTEVKRGKRS